MTERRGYNPKSVRMTVEPAKVGESKVCEYIRDAYINGRTRLLSYATHIDPNIFEYNYRNRYRAIHKLESRDDFEALKAAVLEEDQQDMLLRSSAARRKAYELLITTIEAASDAVSSDPSNVKNISAASNVLKTLMPAFTAINAETDKQPEARSADKLRARAARVIGGGDK